MNEPDKLNLFCKNDGTLKESTKYKNIKCERHLIVCIGPYYRIRMKCPSCGYKSNFIGPLHPGFIDKNAPIKEPINPLLKKLLVDKP